MMRAFSLAELVLAVALLGVLALVAIPISSSIPTARLNVAAKQVQSDIEFARQNAMKTGVTSGVAFVSGGSYTVYQSTTATPLLSPLSKSSMVITLSTDYSGISISTNYTVEFNSFGAPTTGGGGSVTITNGSSNKIISVTANTGRVAIQ